MKSNGDAEKNPQQLEQEVDQQRREIGETVHALEEKFSSREIYNQAAGYVRDHGREFAESLGNSLKANPLPSVLTGIGLLWMMAGQRTPTQASSAGAEAEQGSRKEEMKQKGEQLKGKASSARDKAASRGQDIRERASATGQHLRERAGGAREGFSHSMDSARSNFDYYLQEQPLALGAIGIAVGALVGASVPRTQAEDRTIGDVGERVKGKASEMAEKGYEKANEMGESMGRQAKEALDQERQPPKGTSGRGPAPTP